MWKIASEEIQSLQPIEGKHHPQWLEHRKIDSRYEEQNTVINFWVRWYRQNGMLPPGLSQCDGLIIDGNHRFAAAKIVGLGEWWCNEVYCRSREYGMWTVTGGLVRIRP